LDGSEHTAQCCLAIGADGRESAIRRRASIVLHATEPRLLMAGLLVEDLWGWPEHYVTIGIEGDLVFFIVPQGAGRARLYLLWSCGERRRFAGPGWPRAFLASLPMNPPGGRLARVRYAPIATKFRGAAK